jgi:hypothetical protein
MLMKPLGFQIGEIELEEIEKFNARLKVTGHLPREHARLQTRQSSLVCNAA